MEAVVKNKSTYKFRQICLIGFENFQDKGMSNKIKLRHENNQIIMT